MKAKRQCLIDRLIYASLILVIATIDRCLMLLDTESYCLQRMTNLLPRLCRTPYNGMCIL